jgi:uncharacterized protein YutE (UPF0331/DUF86 family)/predicted nucleotidyltransferase
MSVSPARLQSAVELIRQSAPSLLAVYHYCSTAHRFDRAESDVDLGILAGTPLPRELLWDFAPQLEEIVGRDVDLVDLCRATPVLLMQVLEGKLLFSSDPQQVERSLRRIDEVYAGDPSNLHDDFTKQDSILLNIKRACQAAIDMALRVIRLKQLGLPKESREAFLLLEQHGILPPDLSRSLQAMVGFRNIAVHNYRQLDLQKVSAIIHQRLPDLRRFAAIAIAL